MRFTPTLGGFDMTHYTRDDVQTRGYHGLPSANVKVYRDIRDVFAKYAKDEDVDPRFTLEWIEENVSDEALDSIFWSACESEWDYLTSWATSDEDAIFPAARYGRVSITQEGRSGGWAVVDGLPGVEEWDAILLARWRKFERIAREIADDVPYQMLGLIYLNDFEVWADEQEDGAVYNDAAPVDLHR